MKSCYLTCCAVLLSFALNAQTTWYEIPTGTNKKLNTISFPSSSVGYIGGNDSLLLKSTDGGQTWNEVNYTGVTFLAGGEHILNVQFVSETTGYMAIGPYSGVYKTTNGGLTWTQLTPAGNLCFNEGLFFFDEANGFLGGSGCFQGETIEKMTAGVLAATTINTPGWDASHLVVDIDFLHANFGLGASYGGRILRTTDGGQNWDTIPSGLAPGIPLTSVLVIDDTLAYAGYNDLGSGFGLLRTTDGGLTWAQDMNSATFYYPAFLCLHESANGTIYSGTQPSLGTGGVIFESSDPANVWTFTDVDHPINDMSSYSGSTVFGVGDSGYVVVNQVPANLAVKNNARPEQGLVVYPNPVNDVLNISIPAEYADENVAVFIYTATGQLILESVCSSYDVIDMSALLPGVYLVELRGAGFSLCTRVIKK